MRSKRTEPRRKIYTVLRENGKSLTILPERAPLVVLQPGRGRPPFFIVDSYYYFIDVVQLLGSDQPVLCLVPQEETHTLRSGDYDLHHEAAAHVKTILGRQPRGPYMLGGFSASGIVAYEIAQQLQALGHKVGLLVIFDIPNPYFMREYSAAFLARFAHHRADLSRLRWGNVPGWAAGILRRKIWDAQNFWRMIRLNKTEREENNEAEVTDQFEPFEPRVVAAQNYRPAPYSGRVLLVKRSTGLKGRYLDPQFGWGEVVQGKFEVCLVNAEHHEIFKSKPDREFIAQKLRSGISESIEESLILRPFVRQAGGQQDR
jgi:thioesterase domain-containing protein